jgi:hypothetical protein
MNTSMFGVRRSMFDVFTSQNHQVIPVHHFHALQCARFDFTGTERRNPPREFRPVEIANPHHIFRRKIALATRDARRQQTFALCQRKVKWSSSRSQGQPFGERNFAITRNKS